MQYYNNKQCSCSTLPHLRITFRSSTVFQFPLVTLDFWSYFICSSEVWNACQNNNIEKQHNNNKTTSQSLYWSLCKEIMKSDRYCRHQKKICCTGKPICGLFFACGCVKCCQLSRTLSEIIEREKQTPWNA